MRKEVLIAVFAGSLLGLAIAFGIWRANIALSPKTKDSSSSPTPIQTSVNGLTIARPDDFEVITESSTPIAGISSFAYLVVISGESADYFITPSEDGSFDTTIELNEAANQIIIVAFDASGNQTEKRLTLALSTEFAKELSSPTPTPEENQEATDSVREKVQEKISAARSSPKFIMGTITDKLAQTMEIKNQKGEIVQATASDEETTFIKIDKTKKEVKYADVAIGDFVLAMGFQNDNGVLDSRRVIITSPVQVSARRVILGKITDVQKAQATIESLKESEEITFSNSKDLILSSGRGGEISEIDFSDLDEGQKVAIVGEEEEGKFVARSVRVLPD